MIKIDRGIVTLEGDLTTLINELAALSVDVKTVAKNAGMTDQEILDTLALCESAQLMAHSGMTMEQVEEVLGIPVDREKSFYRADAEKIHEKV